VNVALLVMTDGRDAYLDRSLASASEMLDGITTRWMHDDTGDDAYRRQLARRYPQYQQLGRGPRRGFGGAIQWAWANLAAAAADTFVFHLEADFLFRTPLDLRVWCQLLTERPYLAQMATRRQAWNPDEIAAGGVIEQHPNDYVDHRDHAGQQWLEHRRFFTTNPCLYRRSLCFTGWPDVKHSEGIFGHRLLAGGTPETTAEEVRFGFWGTRTDRPAVEHIGHDRAGTGY
jgi:hypothetical protein